MPFVLQCFDIDDAYDDIYNIAMADALSMKNQDGLDEMVAVALATLDTFQNRRSAPDREDPISKLQFKFRF